MQAKIYARAFKEVGRCFDMDLKYSSNESMIYEIQQKTLIFVSSPGLENFPQQS